MQRCPRRQEALGRAPLDDLEDIVGFGGLQMQVGENLDRHREVGGADAKRTEMCPDFTPLAD